MDAGIILQGRQPNMLNALMGGTQVAQLETDFRRQQDIQNLYRQQGAGIAAGDPNALNALAGFDPMAALGVQDARLGMDATRLQMDATRQSMGMARQQAQQEAQAYAMQMDAAQAAQAAEQLRSTVQGLAMAQSPDQWAGMLAQAGIDPMQAPWDQRDIFLAQHLGAAEVLELRAAQQPEAPEEPAAVAALRIRAQEAGLVPGSPEYQSFMAQGGADTNQMTVFDPQTGRPILMQGSGNATMPTIPERQSQIQLFGSLMDTTGPVINSFEMEYDPANVGDAVARATPIVGNFMQSGVGQQYQAAAAAWSEGALRLATGAAATAPEIERVRNTYFAQPGDSAETVILKRRLREAYQQALVAASAGGFQPGSATLPPDPLGFAEQVAPDVAAPATGASPFGRFETMGASQIGEILGELTGAEREQAIARLRQIAGE